MKKKNFRALLVSCFLTLTWIVLPLVAAGAEPVVLKMVGFKEKTFLFEDETVGLLADKVEKLSKGRLIIKFAGGPEVMRPFDMGIAVKKGVFQMASLPADFYTPLVPGAEVLIASECTPSEERKLGAYDLLLEMHKKAGLFYLGRTSAINVPEFLISSNKPVKTREDLKGLKIGAISPAPAPSIGALGCTFSIVPAPEQYIALEKGVVDGILTTRKMFVSSSLFEVIKSFIDHPFFVGMATTIMNLDAWNQLPKELQDLLIKAQKEAEEEHAIKNTKLQQQLDQKMKDAGVKYIKFSPAEAEGYVKTIYSAFWDTQIKKYPKVGPELMKLLRKK